MGTEGAVGAVAGWTTGAKSAGDVVAEWATSEKNAVVVVVRGCTGARSAIDILAFVAAGTEDAIAVGVGWRVFGQWVSGPKESAAEDVVEHEGWRLVGI